MPATCDRIATLHVAVADMPADAVHALVKLVGPTLALHDDREVC